MLNIGLFDMDRCACLSGLSLVAHLVQKRSCLLNFMLELFLFCGLLNPPDLLFL